LSLIIKISLLSWYPNYTVTESWILFVLLFDAYLVWNSDF